MKPNSTWYANSQRIGILMLSVISGHVKNIQFKKKAIGQNTNIIINAPLPNYRLRTALSIIVSHLESENFNSRVKIFTNRYEWRDIRKNMVLINHRYSICLISMQFC